MDLAGKAAQPLDLPRSLADAVGHHRSGRLAEGEAAYRAVLRDTPEQPDALHLLGVLRHQREDPATAEDLIRRAIAANPNASRRWCRDR